MSGEEEWGVHKQTDSMTMSLHHGSSLQTLFLSNACAHHPHDPPALARHRNARRPWRNTGAPVQPAIRSFVKVAVAREGGKEQRSAAQRPPSILKRSHRKSLPSPSQLLETGKLSTELTSRLWLVGGPEQKQRTSLPASFSTPLSAHTAVSQVVYRSPLQLHRRHDDVPWPPPLYVIPDLRDKRGQSCASSGCVYSCALRTCPLVVIKAMSDTACRFIDCLFIPTHHFPFTKLSGCLVTP